MPEFSFDSTQEDFIKSFKQRTNKIINDQHTTKTGTMSDVDDKTMIENLLYFLTGMDTQNIQFNPKNGKMTINPLYKNHELIMPFESLSNNIRNSKRFVSQMQYVNDSIKRIVGNFLIHRLENYHTKLISCNKNKENIEEILVMLNPFIDEFFEYSFLITNIEILSELEVCEFIRTRSERLNQDYYLILLENMEAKIFRDVLDWMRYGEISSGFFIKARHDSEYQFDECYWINKYKIGSVVPYFLRKNRKIILEAGLFVNIMRITKKIDFNTDEVERELNVGIDNNETIKKIHRDISMKFNSCITSMLSNELQSIYNIYCIKDVSLSTDMLDLLGNEIFHPLDDILHKFNHTDKNFTYKNGNIRINHYILKILNIDKEIGAAHNNLIENLTLTLKNNDRNEKENFLSLFISKKVMFELDIIYRYLFLLFSLHYLYTKLPRNIFVTNAIHYIEQMRSSLYFFINEFEVGKTVDEMVNNFTRFVKGVLNKFYLTSVGIFKLVSDVVDLLFEYLYLKGDVEHYQRRFVGMVRELAGEIEKSCTDYCLLYFLEKFK